MSGPEIKTFARQALADIKSSRIWMQVNSGGGVCDYDEVVTRFNMGANAVSFGSVFIRKPWLPNNIIKKYRKQVGNEIVS